MSIKSFWYKSIFKNTPWVDIEFMDGNLVVKDYNKGFIDENRRKAGMIANDRSDDDIIKFFLNPKFFIEEQEEAAKREAERLAALQSPKIELGYQDGKVIVKSYNKAFVDEQRKIFDELAVGLSDDQVVQLFVNKDSLAKEDPKLEIIHLGIEQDGKVKVELDWNKAFIKHLQENGIIGDDEEEIIKNYLDLLTTNQLQSDDPDEFYTKDQINTVFSEIDKEIEAEFNDIKKNLKKTRKRKIQ